MILDGQKVASGIYDDIKAEISKSKTKPKLGVILVGDDPASLKYIEQKKKFARQVGIDFEVFQFEISISEDQLLEKINELNYDSKISGYIIQLPLPNHVSKKNILRAIKPEKDVDGFHPENQGKLLLGDTDGFLSCTPAGVLKLLHAYKIDILGKKITIIGRSNLVGKPLALLLINAGATVTSCNSHTQNLKDFTKSADIIISAAGQSDLIGLEHIQEEKSVIIDVGFNFQGNSICGDCNFDEIQAAGNPITPVPGGVGPMTVAMLMQNTLKAFHINNTRGNS